MFSKINILEIVRDHTSTLFNEKYKKTSFSDIFCFYILPLLLGSFLTYKKIQLTEGIINIIIASLSIFVGLLLNLLVLMMGILDKYKDKIKGLPELEDEHGVPNPLIHKQKLQLEKRQRLLSETYYNISFAMLVAILCIPIMVLGLLKAELVQITTHTVGYTLIMIFLLTLLMILKRVHIILKNSD